MGSFLVGRSYAKKGYDGPLELCFQGVNDISLVGSATFYSILKLFCDLMCRYIMLYFFYPKGNLLTHHKIRGLVVYQNGAYLHSSVPIWSLDPATNVSLSEADMFSYFVTPWNRPFKARFHETMK